MTGTALQPVVFARAGEVFASSADVAAFFDKDHDKVCRSIRALGIPPDLATSWFRPTTMFDAYQREQPAYDLTRDGFSILAMGFTGKKAMAFKVRYVKAFNVMEATLRGAPASAPPMTRIQLMAQAVLIASEEIAEKNARLAIVEPKAKALDRIEVAKGNLLLTDTAKVLKVNRSHLITVMLSEKALYRRTESGPLVGQQTWIDAGLLSERLNAYTAPDGSDHVSPQITVTPKGAARLASILDRIGARLS